MSPSTAGATYFDLPHDVQVLATVQEPGDRFDETLDLHAVALATLVLANPVGPDPLVPGDQIPAETAAIKVTAWRGLDGLWHWVETPVNGMDPTVAAALHGQRVVAAKVKYPEA